MTTDQRRKERETIRKLSRAIGLIRTYHPRMEGQTMQLFLAVARGDERGVAMQELKDEVGIAQSSASRSVALLSKWHTARTPGAGLVEAFENPEYRREKLVRLTQKGVALKRQIAEILEE